MKQRILGGFLILILVALDQIIKYWVETNLAFQQSEPFIPFVSFYRTYNTGVAFSNLNFIDSRILIGAILVVIILILWLWTHFPASRIFLHLGFIFIIGGALGNFIDRIVFGYVIDFIQFHIQDWSFYIFNTADSFITIGAMLIIADEFRQTKTGLEADQ